MTERVVNNEVSRLSKLPVDRRMAAKVGSKQCHWLHGIVAMRQTKPIAKQCIELSQGRNRWAIYNHDRKTPGYSNKNHQQKRKPSDIARALRFAIIEDKKKRNLSQTHDSAGSRAYNKYVNQESNEN